MRRGRVQARPMLAVSAGLLIGASSALGINCQEMSFSLRQAQTSVSPVLVRVAVVGPFENVRWELAEMFFFARWHSIVAT
jgi:hypothetical protein